MKYKLVVEGITQEDKDAIFDCMKELEDIRTDSLAVSAKYGCYMRDETIKKEADKLKCWALADAIVGRHSHYETVEDSDE